MKYQYIEDFKKLGLGMFVHFGLYSELGMGEWYLTANDKPDKEKYATLPSKFKVDKNWAKNLVKFAKKVGIRYICLTTRHHEGFSLYDTCGMNEYDAPHSACHRDLVREFVDACNAGGIVPFFYHTLIDWYQPSFKNDFDKYIDYLIDSVELLCKNYGKIGGLWFDGYWDNPKANWQFDRLYKVIRKYQPEAMIINNTGCDATGELTHFEIDSVTFERGKPALVDYPDGKERAGEVCDSVTDHWGNTKDDVSFKSPAQLINALVDCKACGCNYLINSGPLANGKLNKIEELILISLGRWIKRNDNFIYNAVKAEFDADNAVVFKDDKYYYAVIKNVPMCTIDPNLIKNPNAIVTLHTDRKILNATWLENKKPAKFVDNKKHTIHIEPFSYGTSLVDRVVRFKLK